MVAPLLLFAVAGVAMVSAGVSMRRAAPINDPGAYLRSLDDYEENDAFQQLLSEPFLARVLRPIGSRALGAISSVLPANYLDSIRQKLLFSGLAGRYRPEEIVTAQVLLAATGFAVGLGYSVLVHATTGLALILTVGLPILGAFYPTGKLTSAMRKRQDQLLGRGRRGLRGRPGCGVRALPVPTRRRVLPYAEGDGARPAEAGGAPEPEEAH